MEKTASKYALKEVTATAALTVTATGNYEISAQAVSGELTQSQNKYTASNTGKLKVEATVRVTVSTTESITVTVS